jgi:hypothetical protein
MLSRRWCCAAAFARRILRFLEFNDATAGPVPGVCAGPGHLANRDGTPRARTSICNYGRSQRRSNVLEHLLIVMLAATCCSWRAWETVCAAARSDDHTAPCSGLRCAVAA